MVEFLLELIPLTSLALVAAARDVLKIDEEYMKVVEVGPIPM